MYTSNTRRSLNELFIFKNMFVLFSCFCNFVAACKCYCLLQLSQSVLFIRIVFLFCLSESMEREEIYAQITLKQSHSLTIPFLLFGFYSCSSLEIFIPNVMTQLKINMRRKKNISTNVFFFIF